MTAWSAAWLAIPLAIQRRFADALASAESAASLAGRAGEPSIALVAAAVEANVLLAAGQPERALEAGERGLAMSQDRGELVSTAGEAPRWRNRITGVGEEALDQLLADPANWRIHPKAQRDAIAGALDAAGWVQQVLVNRRTGFVADGHAPRQVAGDEPD